MTSNQETKMQIGEEMAIMLMTMSDEDKKIAYAMNKGMQVGKQIAIAEQKQKQNKTA